MNEQIPVSRAIIKEVVIEQQQELFAIPRGIPRDRLAELTKLAVGKQILIIQGMRRCGKSILLLQLIDALGLKSPYYLNFEDERLVSFDVSCFNLLMEVFHELGGEQNTFIFDEIQVIPGWERFVRRLHNSGQRIIITGSNATLLSQELGTKLTGRHISLELSEFNFREFLAYKNYTLDKQLFATAQKRGQLLKLFNEYLTNGGLPVYLDSPFIETIQQLYEDIIIRDVLKRYQIDNPKIFRELTFFLTSNVGVLVSFSKLASHFNIGSSNTVIKYMHYLENSYYLYMLLPFSASVKKQIRGLRKIYIASNAFINKVGFVLSNKEGAMLENLVYLALRRRFRNIFYYKTKSGKEVDFLVYNDFPTAQLIQVAWSIESPTTWTRETSAIVLAAKETKIKKLLILTHSTQDTLNIDGLTITVKPIYQWLLED